MEITRPGRLQQTAYSVFPVFDAGQHLPARGLPLPWRVRCACGRARACGAAQCPGALLPALAALVVSVAAVAPSGCPVLGLSCCSCARRTPGAWALALPPRSADACRLGPRVAPAFGGCLSPGPSRCPRVRRMPVAWPLALPPRSADARRLGARGARAPQVSSNMSSGRKAETTKLGTSTISEIFKSTATLHIA